MPNLLQDGANWLIDRLKENGGKTVTYRDYRGEITGLIGTVSQQVYEVVDDNGFTSLITSHDWMFEASDLVMNGSPFLPERNCQVIETRGSQTITYEGLNLGRRPVTEEADTSGIIVVVHTKKVEVVP